MSEPVQKPQTETETPETEIPTVTSANDNTDASTAPAVTPAPEEAAATAAVEETASAAQTPKKGFLGKVFNFAVKAGIGFGVSAALQTGAVFGATLAGAPVWATMLIAGVSVGIGSTLVQDAFKRRGLSKQGGELTTYFSKAHLKELTSKESRKVFGISTVAALVGSALYFGFENGIIQNGWNALMGHSTTAVVVPPVVHQAPVVQAVPHVAATAPVQPVVAMPVAPVQPVVPTPVAPVPHTVAPVVAAPPVHHAVAPVVAPVHCLTPMQQFNNLIQGHHVSAAVHNAMHRAALTNNPHVQAQGIKDLGFYAQNGLGGVPKNGNVALQLFTQAAHEGNKQAMRDMLYLQHYGFDSITANKTASLAAMKSIHHDALATKFVQAWSHAGKAVPAAKFNADTIVKGVKFACN